MKLQAWYSDVGMRYLAGAAILLVMLGVTFHVTRAQTVPATPGYITATPLGCGTGQIDFVWEAIGGASYKIFRNGTQIWSGVPSWFTDAGLTAGVTYSYSVVAYNGYGDSGSVSTNATAPSACSTTPPPPDAPASLTAATGPCGTIEIGLSWTPSTGATLYQLYRDSTLIYSGANTSYTDSGLTAGTQYTYKVLAHNDGGDSGFTSTTGTAPIACTATPAAPGPLTATPQSCGTEKIDLTWSAVAGATSYKVFRGSTLIYNSVATWFTDSLLAEGTQYTYTAYAHNAYGDSPGVTTSATAPNACPPPPTPTQFTATPGVCGSGTINLSWNASADANGYNLKRGSNVLYVGPATSRSITGLTGGTSYTFELNAFNESGSSGYVTATAIAPGACPPPPPTPATLTATPGVCDSHSVSLAWSASSGATGYALTRGTTPIYTGTGLSFTDTMVADDTSYTWKVVAFNAGGTSSAKTASAKSPIACNSIPAAPTALGLAEYSTPTSVSLEWIDNAANETHFIIERKLLGGTYSLLKQLNSANVTAYTDNTVVANTTYGYRVQACRTGAGCSDYSTLGIVSVPAATTAGGTSGGTSGSGSTSTTTSTSGTAPLPPSGISAASGSCGAGVVYISWSASNDAASYDIYRNNSLIKNTTATSFTDTGLQLSTDYSYSIRARNSFGTSDRISFSARTASACLSDIVDTTVTDVVEDTTITPPVSPAQLRQADTSASGIQLQWTDNAADEDSYIVERRRGSVTTYTLLMSLPANTTSFLDTNVSADATYDYRVRVCRHDTCSGYVYLFDVRFRTPNTVATDILKSIAPEVPSVPLANSLIEDTVLSRVAEPTGATQTGPLRTLQQVLRMPRTTVATAPQGVRDDHPIVPPSEEVQRLERVSTLVDGVRGSLDSVKRDLKSAVDQRIGASLQQVSPEKSIEVQDSIREVRQEIEEKIEGSLRASIVADPERIVTLQKDISAGLEKIDVIALGAAASKQEAASAPVANTLATLTAVVAERANELKASGGDLVYKDSNDDGISDYDSVHIYDLDPVKPSPVTIINGEKVKAGDKVLIGLDPKRTEPVQIQHEEARGALTPITEIHKVAEVKLTEEKKVALRGTALPNSYVTLYIYSTPIIVTVKTNADGEWEYTVDKEIETGDHVIYTATVNETGKIVARSNPIPFTRTAEAATLDTVPPLGVSDSGRQDIFENPAVVPLLVLTALFVIAVLFVIGRDLSEKRHEEDAQTV